MSAALVAVFAVAGGLLGWLAVPWAADALLRRVRARADAWWDDSLEAYRSFKRDHPDDEPVSTAPGTEGAVGIWRDEACAAGLAGTLTEERIRALESVGFKVDGLVAAGTDDERCRRYSFRARVRDRAFCALTVGAAFAAAAALVPDVLAATLLGACVFAMAAAVVCDMRARTIPLEACAAVALAGATFQATAHGLEGVAAGLLLALAVVGGCSLANRLLRVRCPGGAVGRGDVRCMGALSLATGAGAACGFAACYALAGLAALAGCATRRLKLGDGMPMAPFLSTWLACGTAASVLLA